MSKKKRKAKRIERAEGKGPAAPRDGRQIMTSDEPHPDHAADPMDGTAAVAPVTDAMMDHAAHEAAALADGVAHGAAATAEAAERSGETAREAAGSTAAAAAEASETAVEVAERASDEAARAAERAADAARESTAAAADALGQYNAKLMDAIRSNVAAASRHAAALVQAKSIPEAMSLNAEHLRQQFEVMTAQGRELAVLAQRVAFDAFKPFKRSIDR